MGITKHDRIAKDLAAKLNTEYNEGKGPDIKTPRRVIEVVTHESDLYTSVPQVSRFHKPKYFAVPPELMAQAREVTEGTGIGLMTQTGKIKKRAHNT